MKENIPLLLLKCILFLSFILSSLGYITHHYCTHLSLKESHRNINSNETMILLRNLPYSSYNIDNEPLPPIRTFRTLEHYTCVVSSHAMTHCYQNGTKHTTFLCHNALFFSVFYFISYLYHYTVVTTG